MASPTLFRYSCGCIGFALETSLTGGKTTARGGVPVTIQKPCIIKACDGDEYSYEYGFCCRELNPENLSAVPLLPEEEEKIWKEIFALVCDGYRARELRSILNRIS